MKKFMTFLIVLFNLLYVNAQSTDNISRREKKNEKISHQKEQTKKLIESKTYTFIADQALPLKGKAISIQNYNVKVDGDTITSYLPYYGRAYFHDFGLSSSPFDFKDLADNYNVTETRRGYKVEFQIKHPTDNISFSFRVFNTGSASLNLISSNRQTISYNGRIVKTEKISQ